MPRQARTESGTGIYHVMLRGIRSAMPLATVGTQERHGILYDLVALHPSESDEGWDGE